MGYEVCVSGFYSFDGFFSAVCVGGGVEGGIKSR